MSLTDIHKSWAEEIEDDEKAKNTNGRKATKEKMKSSDSRENSNSRKRNRPNSKSEDQPANKPKKPLELERDPAVLQRRQKQIDYGKNTVGYHNFTQQTPRESRTKDHPKTPDKFMKYSRRSWDTLIKLWRKKLHAFDTEASAYCESSSSDTSLSL